MNPFHFYHTTKGYITNFLGMPSDSVHIYVGLLALFFAVFILKRNPRSWSALVPCFILSILMEIFDIANKFIDFGVLSADGSFHDVVHTNLVPFILILLFRSGWIKMGANLAQPRLKLSPFHFPYSTRSVAYRNFFKSDKE